MIKVLIIGFDSLDYNLINKFDLQYLKQIEYGMININVEPLSSPVIWASFLTGLPPEKHGITGHGWENLILDKLKHGGQMLRLHKNQGLAKMSLSAFRLLEMLGFKRRLLQIKYDTPTIFDYAEKPMVISVPGYNEESVNIEIRHKITKYLGNPKIEKQIAEKSLRIFEERKGRALKILNEDWDLFMVHFFLPDTIQHIYWYNENKIKKLYHIMDHTAKLFKNMVNDDETFILFVSDHGQEKGVHTPYGFYSCNHKLILQKIKITDFSDIILQKLGIPSKSDIENIKGRLRRLGYLE